VASTTSDFSHRTPVQKLGLAPDQRLELAGDVGVELRRDARDAIARGFVRSGELDGAIVLVESVEEAEEAFARLRPRLRDDGYLWLLTRKARQDGYVPQMSLVPAARRHGLIDNKTCSLDETRSAIRFVVPRALRENGSASPA
jgi:hypothetical protein